MESRANQLTHTRQLQKLVKNKADHSKLTQSHQPQDAVEFKTHWPADQLQLMHRGGLTTLQECSTTVERASTMQFYWWVF